MKKAKRWLALILAVTLVSSNALYQIGTTLSADETQETAADESEEMDGPEEELPDMEDTEAAEVSEVTADDPAQTVAGEAGGRKTIQIAVPLLRPKPLKPQKRQMMPIPQQQRRT